MLRSRLVLATFLVAACAACSVAERLYFISVKAPRIIDSTGQLVIPARERYVPIHSPVQSELLATTRLQLRPPPGPAALPGADESREELRESIDHRPEQRPVPPTGR